MNFTEHRGNKKGFKSQPKESWKPPVQSKPKPKQQQTSSSDSNTFSQDESFEMGKYKTKLCRHWKSGYCLFGPSCVFAHGVDDLCEPNLLMNQMNNLVLVPLNMPGYPMQSIPQLYDETMNTTLMGNYGNSNLGMPMGMGLSSLASTGNHLPVPMPNYFPMIPMMPPTSTQQSRPTENLVPNSSVLFPIMPNYPNFLVASASNQPQSTPASSTSSTESNTTSKPEKVWTEKSSSSTSQASSNSTSTRKGSISRPKEMCTICMDVLESSQSKVLLPCMHEFHSECFKRDEQNILQSGCPHCPQKTSTSSTSSNPMYTTSKKQNMSQNRTQPSKITAE